ncbi:MAG: hypothetical protein KUG78_14355 [Kangiellaceae bacterium]|nr:hypothetical protein [Kangiellaceae bacterium]
MASKIVSNLFWIFAFFCFLLFIQTDDSPHSTDSFPELKHPVEDQKISDNFPQFALTYDLVLYAQTDEDKLSAIDLALKTAKKVGYKDSDILRSLHLKAAKIHESRWHFVYALQSMNFAQSLIYDKKIERRMARLREYLNQVEAERSLNDDYIATKGTGPAKSFRGKVLVAYVFIDDGLKTRWSNKDKQRTKIVLNSVQGWQEDRAREYNITDIEFINKSFVASRNPTLKKPKSISFKSSNEEIDLYVQAVARSLGASSIGEFIETQTVKARAEQGVVILHSNLNERSFANRCGFTHRQKVFKNGHYETKLISNCKDEYVMLMEQVKHNRWDKMHYAQAHEVMHVFGAADLYNIKNASDYAVTDIMNFQSKNLAHSRVEPITAFAIGWRYRPPEAPFQVLEK